MPRAIKTTAPAVIETKRAAKTFTDRGWFGIISSLKKPSGLMVNQLTEWSYFTVNIGTCQQITANFGKNFGIGLPTTS